ncbi:hypothetical protein B0A52_05108 [Exophiala mesophila]|uniref:DNA (cytosine-5-)-methyltransferase n=1 Tax=Exophiala mesophila TaxID=212818 RepID=A0A438N7B6_EXOME|nr:hypothetical protein B0A52_05108 [Exophiala mesophila]
MAATRRCGPFQGHELSLNSTDWATGRFIANQFDTATSSAGPHPINSQAFPVHLGDISPSQHDTIAISDDEDDISVISIDSQDDLSTQILSNFDNVVDLRETSENLDLKKGDSVQLLDRSYLRIQNVTKDRRTQKILSVSGYRLVKSDRKLHLMQAKGRELILLFHEELGKGPDVFDASLESINISDVSKKCNIIFTNQNYQDLSAQNDVELQGEISDRKEKTYFCRWKRILPRLSKCFDAKGDTTHHTGAVIRLSEENCDDSERLVVRGNNLVMVPTKISARDLRNNWRGHHHHHPLGSKVSWTSGRRKQQYTFSDFFCGAGGASCGAYDAGFAINCGVDHNKEAMATYRENFRLGRDVGILSSIGDFIADALKRGGLFRCDICHFSPPCTFASSANTRPNEELDAEAHTAFLAIGDLLRITRPRIATLEEAPALVWPCNRRRPFFTELIDLFLSHGYSVRWKVQNLADWGVPQKRIRLIMIAACPGEPMPSWPEATHGEGALMPHATLRNTVGAIPRDTLDHNPHEVRRFSIPKSPLDWDSLSHTIKCSGDAEKVHHPSGMRGYTIAELKVIQTFPLGFWFAGKSGDKKRQIGNAFPPRAAEVLFSHLRKRMTRQDKREERAGF